MANSWCKILLVLSANVVRHECTERSDRHRSTTSHRHLQWQRLAYTNVHRL